MPAVSRLGDLAIPHPTCPMPHNLMMGSGSVFVNGRPMSFVGCLTTLHTFRFGKWCIVHFGAVALGSITVRVHGCAVARITSLLIGTGASWQYPAGAPGVVVPPIPAGLPCMSIAQGSPTVFAGGAPGV